MKIFKPLIIKLFCLSTLQAQSYQSYIEQKFTSSTININQVTTGRIRTVQLYPKGNYASNQTLQPIVPLGSKLMLEFDELGDQAGYYLAEILHCNYDWKPSAYQPIEYLEGINEIRINDFEISGSAKVPYTHFSLELPRIKLSGNYYVRVFEEGKPQNTVLGYRFIVYESQVQIHTKINVPIGGDVSLRFQQVDFEINYQSALLNPSENVKVTLRQNYRWDNAKIGMKPLFANEAIRKLDYKYFNLENAFKGGNEFRVFDMRSMMQTGINIGKITYGKDINTVYLYPEKPRQGRVYGTEPFADMNGRFVIQHAENPSPTIMADYAEVYFYLQSGNPYQGEVHFLGGFNQFTPNASSLMQYDLETGSYIGKTLLKQGNYNYNFYVVNPTTKQVDEEPIEGSFSQTQNEYDIIVYYRQPEWRGDKVIGYAVVK